MSSIAYEAVRSGCPTLCGDVPTSPNPDVLEASRGTGVGLDILLGDLRGRLRDLPQNLVHLLQFAVPITLGLMVCLTGRTIPLLDQGLHLGVEIVEFLSDAFGIIGDIGGKNIHLLGTNGKKLTIVVSPYSLSMFLVLQPSRDCNLDVRDWLSSSFAA